MEASISCHFGKFNLWIGGFLSGGLEPIGKALTLQGWRMFIDSYHQADLVVNCPGNQFFTMGTFSWPLLVSAGSLFYACLLKNRFMYCLNQSDHCSVGGSAHYSNGCFVTPGSFLCANLSLLGWPESWDYHLIRSGIALTWLLISHP